MIAENELEEMNKKISQGVTIASLAREYTQYDYWEIYWSVKDSSIQGKKTALTRKINKLRDMLPNEEKTLLDDIQDKVDDLYSILRDNSNKLSSITKIING